MQRSGRWSWRCWSQTTSGWRPRCKSPQPMWSSGSDNCTRTKRKTRVSKWDSLRRKWEKVGWGNKQLKKNFKLTFLHIENSLPLFLLGNDFNAMSELRNLKSRIEELETDLRERDEDIKVLKEQQHATHLQHIQQRQNGGGNGEDGEAAKVVLREYCVHCLSTPILCTLF